MDDRALEPLTRAPTLRTASIILDQYHGAFTRAVEAALADLTQLGELVRYSRVGRHLVAPWSVVVAGPPNVGKSSLVNALAGYQRAVVAPVPGTTRDVVTAAVAFDGWPVELADTAGLRETAEELEAEGVGRARRLLTGADLVVWVMDLTDPNPARPGPDAGDNPLLVVNKSDQPPRWSPDPADLLVSAVTGDGVPGLAAAIAHRLVRDAPPAGAAVPFTPDLAGTIEQAHAALTAGATDRARLILATCRRSGEPRPFGSPPADRVPISDMGGRACRQGEAPC